MTHGNGYTNHMVTRGLLSYGIVTLAALLMLIGCSTIADGRSPSAPTPHSQRTAEVQVTVQVSDLGKHEAFTLTVDGSELISPVTARITKEYIDQNPNIQILIDKNGTRRGWKRFCDDQIHINETLIWYSGIDDEPCLQEGIEWIELPIAWQGFGNFVNVHNDFVDCLTADQNSLIWRTNNPAETWNQVNPDWPVEKINRYAALNKSGSPIFVDSPSYEEAQRLDFFDAQNVEALAGDPFGIGLFSAANFPGNEHHIKHVDISVEGECISTDPLNTEPGQQPIWGHHIHLYVNRKAIQTSRCCESSWIFT